VIVHKAGVPLGAVKAKMTSEGVNPDLLEVVDNNKPTTADVVVATTVKDNAPSNKYHKMLKAGVPLGAVKAKMTAEGVNPNLLEAVDNNKVTTATAVSVDIVTTVKDNASLDKYHKMLKAGVPLGAVKAKMTAEGINPDLLTSSTSSDQSSILPSSTPSKKVSFGQNALNKMIANSSQNVQPSGPKLLGLHWDTLPENQLKNRFSSDNHIFFLFK